MTKYGTKNTGLMANYSQNDERYTPKYAIEPLRNFIPREYAIYEPCEINEETGLRSNIPVVFLEWGHDVFSSNYDPIAKTGTNFLELESIDHVGRVCIVTNPPYSLKTKFLRKAFQLGYPFAMLLPTTTLEGMERAKLWQEYGVPQMIIPNRRIDFTGAGNVWYHTSWFTWGLNLPRDIYSVRIEP